MWRAACPFLAALSLAVPAFAQRPAAADKPWPQVAFEKIVDVNALMPNIGRQQFSSNAVTDVTHAGDGSGRLFLVERRGRVWILEKGKIIEPPFLDIVGRTTLPLERGLLGLAFAPDFKTSGKYYASYTNREGDSVIARYRADPANPNRTLPDSEEILLTVPQPYYNHKGGQIAFGPDGMLYFGLGDGGSQRDPHNHGQDLSLLLGKLLRLDVSGPPDEGKKYRVPPDNPFVRTPGARPEIWALGLRNPWRFSFDPATGDLFIGDVGEDRWEEINWQPRDSKGGENYGWSIYEGTEKFAKPAQKPGTDKFTMPAVEISRRGSEPIRSITGGHVYRGQQYPHWDGVYFFADFMGDSLWAMRRSPEGIWHSRRVDGGRTPLAGPCAFGVDEAGNLYVVSFYDGLIYRLKDAAPPPP